MLIRGAIDVCVGETAITQTSIISKPNNKIIIQDAFGRQVKLINLENYNGKIELNTSSFASGVYFSILYQDNKKIKTEKFVVNH